MNKLINPDELLNIEQAIELIGISRVTFYSWMADNKFKVVTIAEKTFITRSEVERLCKERETK
jgi:predicted DNA-binding transcriptional regulator AlpA